VSANGKSWLAYVEGLAWARGSLDLSSYHSFLRAASIGVRPEEALALVATKIKEAGDQPKPAKLNQQLRRAYAFVTEIPKDTNYSHHFVQRERPKFIPEYARKFAERSLFALPSACRSLCTSSHETRRRCESSGSTG
jgi:hypothetical protein